MRAHSQEEQRGQKAKAQAQASQEEQRAAQQEVANKFKRSMAVCPEARGYATKQPPINTKDVSFIDDSIRR